MLINFKRAVSLLAVVTMISAEGVFAQTISDVNGHWSETAFSYCVENGIVAGYGNGLFRPEAPLTKAEAAVILQNIFEYPANHSASYEDVIGGVWYEDAIYAMREKNILSGVSAEIFSPNEKITRQDFAVMLAKAYSFSSETPDAYRSFEDEEDISVYARGAISALVEKGYMSGRSQGRISPKAHITRGEAIYLLYRIESERSKEKQLALDEVPLGAMEISAAPVTPTAYADNDSSDDTDTSNEKGSTPTPNPTATPKPTPAPEIPETKTKILNMTQTGIINVYGVNYALISFTDEADSTAAYTYSLSGHSIGASAVDANGTLVKIELPDNTKRTLAIKSGNKTINIVKLDKVGNSSLVKTETFDSSLTIKPVAPHIVIAEEKISLAQYLNFVKSEIDGSLYTLPVETVGVPIRMRAIEVDAVSSATTNLPPAFENQTENSSIVVKFNLIANHAIAQALQISDGNTARLLGSWEKLNKTLAFNEDGTLYAQYDAWQRELSEANDSNKELVFESIAADAAGYAAPVYAKYLLEKGIYGTKVKYASGQPDSTNPPALSVVRSLIKKDLELKLSEENETWYRYITEISIPYSSSQTYQYNEAKALSENGTGLTIQKGQYGPMHYAGPYTVTIKSHGFEDVTADFSIVEEAPSFEVAWEGSNTRIKLSTADSYYLNTYLNKVSVNGVELNKSEYTVSGYKTLYIPYKYLTIGENTIEMEGKGYENVILTLTTGSGFVVPKAAPRLAVNAVLSGKNSPVVINIEDDIIDEAWLDAVRKENVTFSNYYSSPASPTGITAYTINKDERSIVLTTDNHSFSTLYTYTIAMAVPGYDVVNLTFKPVNAPPALTTKWLSSGNLEISETGSSYSTYISSYVSRIMLDGKELSENIHYTKQNYKIALLESNFTEYREYVIELHDGRTPSQYGKAVLKVTLNEPGSETEPVEFHAEFVAAWGSDYTLQLTQPSGSSTRDYLYTQNMQSGGTVTVNGKEINPGTGYTTYYTSPRVSDGSRYSVYILPNSLEAGKNVIRMNDGVKDEIVFIVTTPTGFPSTKSFSFSFNSAGFPVEQSTDGMTDTALPEEIEMTEENKSPEETEVTEEVNAPEEAEVTEEVDAPEEAEATEEVDVTEEAEGTEAVDTPDETEVTI